MIILAERGGQRVLPHQPNNQSNSSKYHLPVTHRLFHTLPLLFTNMFFILLLFVVDSSIRFFVCVCVIARMRFSDLYLCLLVSIARSGLLNEMAAATGAVMSVTSMDATAAVSCNITIAIFATAPILHDKDLICRNKHCPFKYVGRHPPGVMGGMPPAPPPVPVPVTRDRTCMLSVVSVVCVVSTRFD